MNALAAVRMMVHSDDEEDADTSANHELNDEEFLKLHFESIAPNKPLKSILKRKCEATSGENKVTESETCIPPSEKKLVASVANLSTQPKEAAPGAKGLAHALQYIRENPPKETNDLSSSKSSTAEGHGEPHYLAVLSSNAATAEQSVVQEQSSPPATTSSLKIAGKTVQSTKSSNNTMTHQCNKLASDTNSSTNDLLKKSMSDESGNSKPNNMKNNPMQAKRTIDHKRIVVKITGLPFKYNCTDLMSFLGFWPLRGSDGIHMICDTSGDPSGCAYVELERHKDKMDALRLNGMLFQNRRIKVVLSTANQMEVDWAMTIRITKQIEQSPFVQLVGLSYTADKADIKDWFRKYNRELEDIYCHSPKNDQHNDGTAFVIMDSAEQATKVCKETFIEKLRVAKVHPEQVSRWCRRLQIPLTIRPGVQYDMSVDVPPLNLEPETDDDQQDDNPAAGTVKSWNASMSAKTSDSTETKSESLVYVYDPDTKDEVPVQSDSPRSRHDDGRARSPLTGHPPKNRMPVPSSGPPRGPPGPGPLPMARPGFSPFRGPGPMLPGMVGPCGPFPPDMGPGFPRPMLRGGPGPMPRELFGLMRPQMGPGPFGPLGPRPMFPQMGPGPMGMRLPGRPDFMPTIYVRMYNLPEQASTEDIKNFFLPILPAKIAQNVGYNIYDVDFYAPDDARMALQRQGMLIRKNKISLEMLPGPPVPLPPRLEEAKRHKKKKRKSVSPPPLGCVPPPPHYRGPGHDHQPKPKEKKSLDPRKAKTKKVALFSDEEDTVEKIHIPPFPSDPLKYRLAPYHEGEPTGQCAIQVMEGYFCQLCRKFYNSRSAGMVSHCKTKQHYEKVKAHLAKLKAATENR